MALQCSPDHPWLKEHPECFRRRPREPALRREPAEEIRGHYPLDFACRDWKALWTRLKSVF